jgi:thymidylate synthase
MSAQTANGAWLLRLHNCYLEGDNVSPRGKPTKEEISPCVWFDMRYPIVTEPARKLSYRFMAAEASWILDGSSYLDYHPEIEKKLKPYSDNGSVMAGAYGPRIQEQLNWVIDQLRKDQDTRQAVLTIWDRCPRPSKDIPCTVSMQFLVRDNKVHLVVFMRSSDVWMGLPYDMFSFSMVAHEVGAALGIELGDCYITAGSSHLYESNWIDASNIIDGKLEHLSCYPFSIKTEKERVLYNARDQETEVNAKFALMNWEALSP